VSRVIIKVTVQYFDGEKKKVVIGKHNLGLFMAVGTIDIRSMVNNSCFLRNPNITNSLGNFSHPFGPGNAN